MRYLVMLALLGFVATGCCQTKKTCPMKADAGMNDMQQPAAAAVEQAAPAAEAAVAPVAEAAQAAEPMANEAEQAVQAVADEAAKAAADAQQAAGTPEPAK